ncbi:alpha/beta hydrolase [Myxosarcina sp. GI1(2024)]
MKTLRLILGIALTSCGILAVFRPPPVIAAENISFSLSFLGEFTLPVEDLEIFAKEGRITPKFAYYADLIEPRTRQQLRHILQTSFTKDPVKVYRLTNTPMGEDFLRQMGNIIYTHPQSNGFYAIRAALIQASGEPEGLTAINFLRHFPTKEIHLNANTIFSFIQQAEKFFDYRDSTVKAIAQQAEREIVSRSNAEIEKIPDLRQPGDRQVNQTTITFPVDELRQTDSGFAGNYNLDVDIYSSQKSNQPAPLVIITHGFGSHRSDFDYLAKHLASYGYVVAIPEHIGSSHRYKQAYMRGEVSVAVSPVEFYSRPRDITYLLDRLEQHPDYQQQINWSQIGVLGHSLGGTTALVVSGAPLNLTRLTDVCGRDRFPLNISLFLQCRASSLPPGNYNLRDPRIKAVAAFNPVISSVLGIESMQQIALPTLIVGGTRDFVSPYIDEQVHPFLWLTTPHKYLATIVNGSHFSTVGEANIVDINNFINGSEANFGQDYLKALSLAFLEVHLRDRPEYRASLTAAYGYKISNPKLPLHLIQSLTSEQLESAYGKTPPITPIPESLVTEKSQPNRNVLAEIEQTGVLKVGMRTDAAPFGYTERENYWNGYCADLADALGDRLTKKLNTSTSIKVVKIPSSLANRFKLVEQGLVHLECGPNSIVSDREEITFSDPFFSSGTRFLINKTKASRLDFSSSLEGLKLGVLGATTNKQFLQQNYPNAEIVAFESMDGRSKAIQAIKDGTIDAFASDSVLLMGELDRRGLNRKNYQTIPAQPLTCDYYGLILPKNDSLWLNTVNSFIYDRASKSIFNRWLTNYYDRAIADLDYCQN